MEAQADEQPPDIPAARIEVIDADHARWPQVLEMIDRLGAGRPIGIEPDWIPARRSLLVAFVEDQTAGHLSFQLEPVVDRNASERRMRIEARVDGYGVADGYDRNAIVTQLVAAARRWAARLQAETFHPGQCADA